MLLWRKTTANKQNQDVENVQWVSCIDVIMFIQYQVHFKWLENENINENLWRPRKCVVVGIYMWLNLHINKETGDVIGLKKYIIH